MIHHLERKILAVIGAGPKGIAVAVKAKVLEEFGFVVDHVILIERNGVAAHWSGDFGYTNGEMKLGTSPERDVVFPLDIDVGDETLNTRIKKRLLHFTWTSFLVHTHRHADWVDRGQHTPCHKLWALYLQWVAEQLKPAVSAVTIVAAEVVQIDLTADGKRWELTIQASPKQQRLIAADRLMLTGPGKTRMDFMVENASALPSSIYDLESFWAAIKTKTFSTAGKLAIVGTGENAASTLLALSQYAPHLRADVISPKGSLFSRAENYYENQFFSQPEKNDWSTLEMVDRLDFIKRTDLSRKNDREKASLLCLVKELAYQVQAGKSTDILIFVPEEKLL